MVEIPDDAFMSALIVRGVDKNGDGEICPCEAEEITSLDTLSCGWCQLSALDVSNIRNSSTLL